MTKFITRHNKINYLQKITFKTKQVHTQATERKHFESINKTLNNVYLFIKLSFFNKNKILQTCTEIHVG